MAVVSVSFGTVVMLRRHRRPPAQPRGELVYAPLVHAVDSALVSTSARASGWPLSARAD